MIRYSLAVAYTILIVVAPLAAQDLHAPERLGDGLEVALPGMNGLHLDPRVALNQSVFEAAFPNTTSVLVLKDGKLVFERYFGTGGRDVLNDTRSAMKSVIALAIGAALADGALQSAD